MIYDEFQKWAIEAIDRGESTIVSAPTGAGKTAIAEYAIRKCLQRGERVVYTAPLKALSNQKYREFGAAFPGRVGILTGDVSLDPRAPLTILTTEILRNQVLEGTETLADVGWVIFDEIHYLDDPERGTVWEETLILLPPRVKILALSATIPNIREFAGWIESIRKNPLTVIVEEKRPVPLHFLFQSRGKILDSLERLGEEEYRADRRRPADAYSRRGEEDGAGSPAELIQHLREQRRLPCLYFAFSRRRCEELAEEMSSFNLLQPEEKRRISELYDRLCARFDLAGERSAEELRPLIERGIAYHHAGLLPTVKEVVEQLFYSRLIKLIFATETFALGINMPARSVAFDRLQRFTGTDLEMMKTRDFYQMAGRAGRRGIDAEGYVYCRVHPRHVSTAQVKMVILGTPEKVHSRFNASYASILNLYRRHGERVTELYPLTFHYFRERESARAQAARLLSAKLSLLKDLGYIARGALTGKGNFAAGVYGYEMPAGELFGRGFLDRLSSRDLAALCLALVFEPSAKLRRLKPREKKAGWSKELKRTVGAIHRAEDKLRISPRSKDLSFHLTDLLWRWMGGSAFAEVTERCPVDEGELVRYFRMCVQILREIHDAPGTEPLRGKVRDAIARINRGVVDAERQLRS
jgi:superfamily II RNA helicase